MQKGTLFISHYFEIGAKWYRWQMAVFSWALKISEQKILLYIYIYNKLFFNIFLFHSIYLLPWKLPSAICHLYVFSWFCWLPRLNTLTLHKIQHFKTHKKMIKSTVSFLFFVFLGHFAMSELQHSLKRTNDKKDDFNFSLGTWNLIYESFNHEPEGALLLLKSDIFCNSPVPVV